MTAKDHSAEGRKPTLPPILTGHPDVHLRAGVQYAVKSKEPNSDSDNAFFVADLGEVYRLHEEWKRHRPSIDAYYAVKTNPSPPVVQLLASLGCGFDCASYGEIQQILDLGFVNPSRIIYAHPIKTPSHLHFASENGVNLMTFDNHNELEKIADIYPKAKLVLRLLVDDSHSEYPLGGKFGAPLDDVPSLLYKAQQLGLNVVGVSYHVGSGNISSGITAHVDAIRRSKLAFEMAKEVGYSLDLLDVGGGFEKDSLEDVAKALLSAVDQYFSDDVGKGLRIIAEPGRYFVTTAFQLAVCIVGRREPGEGGFERESPPMYYINEGIYGSFYEGLAKKLKPEILYSGGAFEMNPLKAHSRLCIIWGQTCCPTDCINDRALLPDTLRVGDWIKFPDMGAYTFTSSTIFNMFEHSKMVFTFGEDPCVAEQVRQLLIPVHLSESDDLIASQHLSGDEE